ncbi:F-box domain [Arabidopsis thaliana x Arabidopsis arenosa]|uniref:F-box domain n=1 Tax=Arabidopsis thaliana x Arabidopsis arenosa TaxID=1240361 RepID=A0A8T2AXC9_9BRAS|nr:F-box domain [Arabidopsis thaliana x Arabidopsis arenosa]
MSDLPLDLVEEILSRVPATSLKRLRSTCKKWNALLNIRRFTEKHLREAPKQSHALLWKDFRVCPMRINLNVAAPSIEFKSVLSLKNSHNNSEHIDIAKVLHCDGLLLCTTKDGRLVLWNPCLGETRWIQLEADYEKHTRFALGYQNNKSCRCYKILRFSKSYLTPNHMDVVSKIYELTSDSWRVLLDKVALNYFLLESENSVSLKGNTYWFALDDETSFLLGFDFTTERFNRFCLPSTEDLDMMVLSVFREEKLSVSHQKFRTSKMDIWMTNIIDNEAALSWKKSFSIEFKILSTCHYFSFCNSFLIHKEKKVVVCTSTTIVRDKNMVSIIGEDNAYYTEIPVESTNCSCSPYIFNYVPSLVQIQQC